jgi:hypothetical protein
MVYDVYEHINTHRKEVARTIRTLVVDDINTGVIWTVDSQANPIYDQLVDEVLGEVGDSR